MAEADIATLTHRLAAITRRAIGERMANESWAHEAGFRPGCIGVLRVVAAREPVSQREVSEALLLDPSDLVTLVDILEGAGLVERRRDPADRRRYALEVTPRGQLAVVRLREINRETNEELLAPLDELERAQLAELIGRVVRHHTGEPESSAAGPSPAEPAEPAERTESAEPAERAQPAAGRADSAGRARAGGRSGSAEPAGAPAGRADSAGHARAGGRSGSAEPAGAPAGRAASAGRTVATARSEADEDGMREVPVMPGHPERAREPYEPNREAERARTRAAEPLRP